jgi:SAM-dependent methyltransferase
MKAIVGSASDLPFEDNSFDAVVASDVLEHIPPEARVKVIHECLRVCKTIAIFGFPCGPLAWEIDRKLHESYLAAGETSPIWLLEHMEHAFPTPDVFDSVTGWSIQQIPNEHLKFHLLMMQLERRHRVNRVFAILLESAPWLLRPILNLANRYPAYRNIFVLKKLKGGVAT